MTTTRFKLGQSGNPAGRPKGSRNKATLVMAALQDDLESLVEVTKQKALEGDTTAAKLLLERLIPTKKPLYDYVTIEGLGEALTLSEKARLIISAVGDGNVAPDVGVLLITAIGNTAKIIETDELLKRVEALENVKDTH